MQNIKILKPTGLFTNYIYKAIPLAFDESMSYYETLCGLLSYLKDTVIPTVNNNADAVIELQNLYTELHDYVEHYFDNLDVQEEINNKLDEMAEQGTLQEIIADYLNSKAIFGYDNVASMKNATNLINGSYARTLGYYTKNDDGGALYKIRTITNDDVVDNGSIIALDNINLVAELIIEKDIVNVKQFGVYSDNDNDDTTQLQLLINYANANYLKIIGKKENPIKITSTLNFGIHTNIENLKIFMYQGTYTDNYMIYVGNGLDPSYHGDSRPVIKNCYFANKTSNLYKCIKCQANIDCTYTYFYDFDVSFYSMGYSDTWNFSHNSVYVDNETIKASTNYSVNTGLLGDANTFNNNALGKPYALSLNPNQHMPIILRNNIINGRINVGGHGIIKFDGLHMEGPNNLIIIENYSNVEIENFYFHHVNTDNPNISVGGLSSVKLKNGIVDYFDSFLRVENANNNLLTHTTSSDIEIINVKSSHANNAGSSQGIIINNKMYSGIDFKYSANCDSIKSLCNIKNKNYITINQTGENSKSEWNIAKKVYYYCLVGLADPYRKITRSTQILTFSVDKTNSNKGQTFFGGPNSYFDIYRGTEENTYTEKATVYINGTGGAGNFYDTGYYVCNVKWETLDNPITINDIRTTEYNYINLENCEINYISDEKAIMRFTALPTKQSFFVGDICIVSGVMYSYNGSSWVQLTNV